MIPEKVLFRGGVFRKEVGGVMGVRIIPPVHNMPGRRLRVLRNDGRWESRHSGNPVRDYPESNLDLQKRKMGFRINALRFPE